MSESKLSRDSKIPLHIQLRELLEQCILDGLFPAGESIPTEKELAEMYALSRTTVRQAVTELKRRGLICSVRGKGSFVSVCDTYGSDERDKRLRKMLEQRTDSIERTERMITLTSADESDAELLGIEPGVPILSVTRIGYDGAGKVVECTESRYIAEDI